MAIGSPAHYFSPGFLLICILAFGNKNYQLATCEQFQNQTTFQYENATVIFPSAGVTEDHHLPASADGSGLGLEAFAFFDETSESGNQPPSYEEGGERDFSSLFASSSGRSIGEEIIASSGDYSDRFPIIPELSSDSNDKHEDEEFLPRPTDTEPLADDSALEVERLPLEVPAYCSKQGTLGCQVTYNVPPLMTEGVVTVEPTPIPRGCMCWLLAIPIPGAKILFELTRLNTGSKSRSKGRCGQESLLIYDNVVTKIAHECSRVDNRPRLFRSQSQFVLIKFLALKPTSNFTLEWNALIEYAAGAPSNTSQHVTTKPPDSEQTTTKKEESSGLSAEAAVGLLGCIIAMLTGIPAIFEGVSLFKSKLRKRAAAATIQSAVP